MVKDRIKISVITDSIDVNDSSGSKANVGFILNLKKIGYQVEVFHYTQKNISLKSIQCISIKEQRNTLNFVLSRLQRLFTRYTKLNLHRFFENWFGFSFTFFNDINSIQKELRNTNLNESNLIITLSKGGSFRPHYAVLQLPELHSKWMAYIHDPYPFVYYPPPYEWTEPGYKTKIKFFKELSLKAKYTAFPSQLLKEWMGKYFPIMIKNGIVIPHQNINIEIQDKKAPSYFNSNNFNLLHAGNLMKQRNPKGLIEGFKLFLLKNSNARIDARLLLIGNASYHQKLLDTYKNISELIVITSNCKFEEVYTMQQEASVNIILEAKAEVSPFLPGKFPHCVLANKPIFHLGPKHSETMRLLGNDYPFHAEIDNINEISIVIEQMYLEWRHNKDSFLLNRKDLEFYTSENQLEQILENVLVNNE